MNAVTDSFSACTPSATSSRTTRAACRAGAPAAATTRSSPRCSDCAGMKDCAPKDRLRFRIGCSSRFPHYMKTYGFHGSTVAH